MIRRLWPACFLLAMGCGEKPPELPPPVVSDVEAILVNPQWASERHDITVNDEGWITARVEMTDNPAAAESKVQVETLISTKEPDQIELVFKCPKFKTTKCDIAWQDLRARTSLGEFTASDEGHTLTKTFPASQLDNFKIPTPISQILVGGVLVDPGSSNNALTVIWLCAKDPFYAGTVRQLARKSDQISLSPKQAMEGMIKAEKDLKAKQADEEAKSQEPLDEE